LFIFRQYGLSEHPIGVFEPVITDRCLWTDVSVSRSTLEIESLRVYRTKAEEYTFRGP